jgi:hypothetical protein
MPQANFLVDNLQMAAQIFDRMDVEVLVSSKDRSNVVENKLTMRAEQRLALAIKRPDALATSATSLDDRTGDRFVLAAHLRDGWLPMAGRRRRSLTGAKPLRLHSQFHIGRKSTRQSIVV